MGGLKNKYNLERKSSTLNYKYDPKFKKVIEPYGNVPQCSIPFTGLCWKNATVVTYIEAVLALCLLPIRLPLFLVSVIGFLISANICGKLVGYKVSPESPKIPIIPTIFKIFAFFFARCVFFSLGIIYIKTTGKRDKNCKMHCFGPHGTIYDLCYLFSFPFMLWYSPISKAAVQKAVNMIVLQPFLVDQTNPENRKQIADEIHRRCNDSAAWNPIWIFPQGTCGNRTALTQFSLGAFTSKKPVQPVRMQIGVQSDTLGYTAVSASPLKALFTSFCRVYIPVTYHFLPVYEPNEIEKKDPVIFAENVRKIMAEDGNLAEIDGCYLDVRCMWHWKKKHGGKKPYAACETMRLKAMYKAGIDQIFDSIFSRSK